MCHPNTDVDLTKCVAPYGNEVWAAQYAASKICGELMLESLAYHTVCRQLVLH